MNNYTFFADAQSRWQNKKVIDAKKVLVNVNSQVGLVGIGRLEISKESIMSMTSFFCLHTNVAIPNLEKRPSNTITVKLDDANLEAYNRVSCYVYPKSDGHHNFYFHFSLWNKEDSLLHAPSLEPNKWNHIVWELDEFVHNCVNRLTITPYIMGNPDEALPELDIYFGDICFEKVAEDYVLGWDLENRIAFSHIGYETNSQKIAITQNMEIDDFAIVDEKSEEVFCGSAQLLDTLLGKYKAMDFSGLKKCGNYYLKYGAYQTPLFKIGYDIYDQSLQKSLSFLRQLRCGCDVKGVHSECHLNNYVINSDKRILPVHGGWHDAGDVSQFAICTAEIAFSLLDLAKVMQEKKEKLTYYKEITDEARWGLNWLLRTRFNDGNRALAVHYVVWMSNVTSIENFAENSHMYKNNFAENGAFENILIAATEAKGYLVFKEEDEVFANWCKRIAISDFEFGMEGFKKGHFTKRWGKIADAQMYGIIAVASSLLYQITHNNKYQDIAVTSGRELLLCQQQEYINMKALVRGFFWEEKEHKHILCYEHRHHEQFVIQGLVDLCKTFRNHHDYSLWVQGLDLYREYILFTVKYTAPYGLVPAHIYKKNSLNFDRFTIPNTISTEEAQKQLEKQIEQGINLGDDFYLRIFPISIQRRGFHATLLGKTKAISLLATFFHDDDLLQISRRQLEWIFGFNPFASSTMYKLGHNYHPLYVAFSLQMEGALPVGFKTYKEFDKPYWPTSNNAVFKEIWGHTTGKYLWILADIL